MFNILHVKYALNVVQNTLMSINCICTIEGIIKLTIDFTTKWTQWPIFGWKTKKIINTKRCTIY